jgi:hypothetical protein
MNMSEALFLLSSTLVLPAVVILLLAYFNGSLTAMENARFVVLLDPEADYWSQGLDAFGSQPAAPPAPRDGGNAASSGGGRE